MKKIITGIVFIAVLFFVIIYFLIPSTLTISNTVYNKTTLAGALRYMMTEEAWKKWWVDKKSISENKFEYKGDEYKLTDTRINTVIITIHHNNEDFKTEMQLFRISDSIIINWKFIVYTSLNPFKRISEYREANVLKANTSDILNHFKKFIENNDVVYEIPIRLSSIEHIFLITTKTTFNHYPSTAEIYNNINFLKRFSTSNGLKQNYYPMMNVTMNNDTSYRLMVALPVDKETSYYTGAVHSVRMVQGNYMVTQVRGGYKTVNNALDEMQLYFDDYNKTAMAIPFQYLVTDRTSEPDTAKWLTKIYAPVY